MPNQPTSFRYPFDHVINSAEGTHQAVKDAIRYAFTGLKDLNDAVNKLNSKVNTNTETIKTVSTTVTQGGSTPAPSPTPTFGNVNLQPGLTPGAYTLAQSDLGGLIMVQSGVPFALTLNSGLVTPFFTSVYNLGVGAITATPSLGTVNNVGSMVLTTNQFGIFYFDGVNWWEVFSILPVSFPHVLKNWLDSYDSTTGILHASQPQASDLQNGTTGGGKVVLESGPTLHSPTIDSTAGGPMKILGLLIFANNAAAIAGGLVVGNIYRLGADPDIIAIVH